jgi:S-DNA-T family DNA segregation ATPase FtsK/SpoIIIE
LPRSTTRSQRPSGSATRRGSRARTPIRGRKPARPLLTATQAWEVGGVALGGAGLIALIAMLFGGGPLLAGLQHAVSGAFGVGWPLPVAGAVVMGGLMIWPQRARPRATDILAATAASLSFFGLLSLAHSPAGGRLGQAVSEPTASLLGRPGAVILLVSAFLVGVIVAFHFSPGAVLLGVVRAGQAAYAERRRLNALVERAKLPAKMTKNASVSHAVPPPRAPAKAPGQDTSTPVWDLAANDEPPAMAPEFEPEIEAPSTPAFASSQQERIVEDDHDGIQRVVAEPEDDDRWAEIDWKLPGRGLLENVRAKRERMEDEIKRNVRIIESTLQTFGVQARVIGVNSGPAVTQYELQPAAGVPVKRIVALQNDLSLTLAASPLRIEAPIPGKSAVGVEVPNKAASLVSLREVVESPGFTSGHALAVALGHDVSGQPIVSDLARMPHLLIAGATGQGKSVCINALICSLLIQMTPAQLRLVMVDPKRVELNQYNGLPHLAVPVIVESHQAASALRWAVIEMDRRYKLLSAEAVRNIKGYNEKALAQRARPLPYVVVVIDELADLMMVAAGEIEELICRIAQLARAVGIHLVIATQRPSTDIITGLIKANIPSRIAFAVGSQVDSRVILDTSGAEKLLGRGDMLYQPVDAGKPTRVQGALITDREVEGLVSFWKQQADPQYMDDILDSHIDGSSNDEGSRKLDPLFARAARAICAEGTASVSLVQRKFNVGYSRAGRIIDQLADHRVIGRYQGSKSREILMTLPEVDELLERVGIEG